MGISCFSHLNGIWKESPTPNWVKCLVNSMRWLPIYFVSKHPWLRDARLLLQIKPPNSRTKTEKYKRKRTETWLISCNWDKIYDIIFEHSNDPLPSPVWTILKKTALCLHDGFPYSIHIHITTLLNQNI